MRSFCPATTQLLRYGLPLVFLAFVSQSPQATAQIVLVETINHSFESAGERVKNDDITRNTFRCAVYWDNWVYAYGLDLFSDEVKTRVTQPLRLPDAGETRDAWLLKLANERLTSPVEARESINGPSADAEVADADMNSLFNGEEDATRRVAAMLGYCAKVY